MDRGNSDLEQAVCQAWEPLTWRATLPGLPANLERLFKDSPIFRQGKHSFFEQIQASDVIC
jgi:hypothetical protein